MERRLRGWWRLKGFLLFIDLTCFLKMTQGSKLLQVKLRRHVIRMLGVNQEGPNSNLHSAMELTRWPWAWHYLSAKCTLQGGCEDKSRWRNNEYFPELLGGSMGYKCGKSINKLGKIAQNVLLYLHWRTKQQEQQQHFEDSPLCVGLS